MERAPRSVLIPELQEGLYIRVFSAGYIELGDWWPVTDQLRGFWRLYRNEETGVGLVQRHRRFDLPARRLALIPPGFEFDIELARPVAQLFAHFEILGRPPEASKAILPEPQVLEPDPLREALVETLRGELSAARRVLAPALASKVKALVHLSMAALIEQVPADRARLSLRISAGQKPMLAVLHHIDEHLSEPLGNAELASIACSSESRFIRRFREATGLTPARYVQERRLERASEMLVATDQGIDEIAEACGFANRYYFTRVFTQRMGMPPGRYRSERPHLPQMPRSDA